MGAESARRPGPVWLVGMMGVGKSTVGRQLAERLGCRFVDADREIEARAGLPIPQIFEREGEAGFRARERAVVEELAGSPAVIALGGGAVGQPEVRARIAASGTVVYLRAGLDTLMQRVGRGRGRPLLAGLSESERRQRLARLLEERRAYYEEAAIVVDSEGLDARVAARRVAEALDGAQAAAEAPRNAGEGPLRGSARRPERR